MHQKTDLWLIMGDCTLSNIGVKAVYLAIKRFRLYFLGTPFKLVPDGIAFKQILKKSDVLSAVNL